MDEDEGGGAVVCGNTAGLPVIPYIECSPVSLLESGRSNVCMLVNEAGSVVLARHSASRQGK